MIGKLTLAQLCSYVEHSLAFAKDHVPWIIKKVNSIPMHCGVAYESVLGHVIRVCVNTFMICHMTGKLQDVYSVFQSHTSSLMFFVEIHH